MNTVSNNAKPINHKNKLSKNEAGLLLLLAGILSGAYFRLSIPAASDFPIGDGGLFYVMIQAIQANSYRLPEFVTYNGLSIPFSYPPLAFYLVGMVADIFGVPLIDVMRWFPAIILVITLPFVYLLANSLLRAPLKAGLAVFIFALLPRSVTWLIKGGGVTRSVGQLILILATVSLFFLFKSRERKYLAPSILLSSLVCITHPEAALHTAGFGLILWLFYGRNKEGVYHAALTAIGTFVSTSIWWLPTISHHGFSPFLNAAQTGFNNPVYYITPFFLSITDEPFLPIITLLAVIGFTAQAVKREFLFPALYVFPFLVEPRNAPNVAIISTAILAAIALTDVLLPAIASLSTKPGIMNNSEFLNTGAEKFLFIYLTSIMLIGMLLFTLELREEYLAVKHRKAFEWIKNNTPMENSSFLVITNRIDSLSDPVNEWFPVLTNRASLTTLQGYEWVENGGFSERILFLGQIQDCDSIECIETSMEENGTPYNYIYIPNSETRLALELRNTAGYQLVYEKDGIQIYQKH